MNFYDDPETASQFIEFLGSENGKIQKDLLLEALLPHLPTDKTARILDAACGTGWFGGKLLERGYKHIEAFDASAALISEAEENAPEIKFVVADASGPLPYSLNIFDTIILNMASHDLEDQKRAFANFYNLLKPGGELIVTMANPYYSFPVGVWKRSWLGKILRFMPELKLRPYNLFKHSSSNTFKWNKLLTSRFYPLADHMNNILQNNFQLVHFQELQSLADCVKFNSSYQLYRFPLILLLKFRKPVG